METNNEQTKSLPPFLCRTGGVMLVSLNLLSQSLNPFTIACPSWHAGLVARPRVTALFVVLSSPCAATELACVVDSVEL